jgi:hypothetical protein
MGAENRIITGNTTANNNQVTGLGGRSNPTPSTNTQYGRVIEVNTKDRSIKYELVTNNLGPSASDNKRKFVGVAKNINPNLTRLPVVDELVPLIKGPTPNIGSSAGQFDQETYYGSPISIQGTVDDNKVPQDKTSTTNNPNSLNNYKMNEIGANSNPNSTPNSNQNSERQGTDTDGINGEYTSQFIFPKGLMTLTIELKGKPPQVIKTALGIAESNNILISIVQNYNLTIPQMEAWNEFQTWMQGKKYSGNKSMNTKPFSKNVWSEYKTKVKKDFWVTYTRPDNTSDDIRKIQDALKIYRAYLINEWKTKKPPFNPGIKLRDLKTGVVRPMDVSLPDDVKNVEENFMKWAKPTTYN